MTFDQGPEDNLDDLFADPPELPLWPRDHDLPPRWDGRPVEWGEWTDTAGIIICPPPRGPQCHQCRSTRAPLLNLGRIWTDPAADMNVASIRKARLDNGKHLVGTLSAFRCPDCQRDYVLDCDNNAWTLDQTDYTDTGSYETGAP